MSGSHPPCGPASFLPTLLAVVLLFASLSANAKPPPATELKAATWSIPVVALAYSGATGPEGERVLLPGFEKSEIPDQYGVSGLLKAIGVTSPDGSEAVFDQNASTLFVKNTAENLERIEFVLARSKLADAPFEVALDMAIFECTLLEPPFPSAPKWPKIEDLRKLPPDKIAVLHRATKIVQSSNRHPTEQTRDAASLKSGQDGLDVIYEAHVELQYDLIVGILNFLWEGKNQTGAPARLKFSTSFRNSEGSEFVLFMSRSATSGKYYVITARQRIAPPAGLDLKKLRAVAARYPATQPVTKGK